MKRKILELIIIILFYCLSVTLGRVIELGGIKPNMLIVLPILFGYLNGSNEGMFVGFFSGLIYDIFISTIVGFSPLVFSILGYVSGLFFQKYEKSEIIIPLIIVAFGDIIYEFLSYIGNFLLHNRLNVLYFVKRFMIPEMIYTVLFFVLLFKPIVLINPLLSGKKKRRVSYFDERDN